MPSTQHDTPDPLHAQHVDPSPTAQADAPAVTGSFTSTLVADDEWGEIEEIVMVGEAA